MGGYLCENSHFKFCAMKKSAFIFASAIVAAMMCVFTGCSDDSDGEDSYVEVTWSPNQEVIAEFSATTTPIAFKSTGEILKLRNLGGNKWGYYLPENFSRLSFHEIIGFLPDVVMFKEGNVYGSIWSYDGRSWIDDCVFYGTDFMLYCVWKQYIADTHDQQIYVEADFGEKENLLKFNDGTFALFTCEDDEMAISDLSDDIRSLWYYKPTTVPEEEDCYVFANCKDAFQFIIDCAREKYGDKVICREYYVYNDVAYEKEFDLNQIEEMLNKGWL